MTPAQRLRAAEALYWMARQLREAAESAKHPEWGSARVADEVRRIFLRAAT
jgi:hypothetical protein